MIVKFGSCIMDDLWPLEILALGLLFGRRSGRTMTWPERIIWILMMAWSYRSPLGFLFPHPASIISSALPQPLADHRSICRGIIS